VSRIKSSPEKTGFLIERFLWPVGLLISLIIFVEPVEASTRKAPYLIYPGDNTQMEVLWQLTTNDTCSLSWGIDTTYADGTQMTYEYGTDHQHKYIITDLTPGIKYYYQVDISGELHRGSFTAVPPDTARYIKFFAYGDTRSYPATHNQVAAGIISTFTADPDYQTVILSVGDLVNSGNTEADWDSQFFSPAYTNIQAMLAGLPYQAAMGNHEGTGVLFTKYFPYPFTGGRYWSFDYGPMHVAIVDQYTGYSPGSAQLVWLENDLAESTKLWKFIVLHEPGWSAGDHSNNTSVQNYIQPLCLEYGVSIVFGGHNHYYARAVVNGVEHLTIGGGGAPLYQPIPTYPYIVATSRSNHYTKIEIDDNWLYFKAINTAGNIIDSFSIYKGPDRLYIPGDVNMSSGAWPPLATGPDVTYLVNYFRSLPANQACLLGGFWCSADANGDCSIIGSDVTKLVNVFRGIDNVEYCVDYPTAWPTPADLPSEAPEGWPGCETAATGEINPTRSRIK